MIKWTILSWLIIGLVNCGWEAIEELLESSEDTFWDGFVRGTVLIVLGPIGWIVRFQSYLEHRKLYKAGYRSTNKIKRPTPDTACASHADEIQDYIEHHEPNIRLMGPAYDYDLDSSVDEPDEITTHFPHPQDEDYVADEWPDEEDNND